MQMYRSPEDRLKDAQANARFWEKKHEQAEKRYKKIVIANRHLMEELEEMEKLGEKKGEVSWNIILTPATAMKFRRLLRLVNQNEKYKDLRRFELDQLLKSLEVGVEE